MPDDLNVKISEEINKEPEAPIEPVEPVIPEETKVKVGEDEYSQEDLQRLVGLGKIATEAETKYNTKIDRVWPEYTKAQNRIKELEAKPDETKTPDELSEEEQIKQGLSVLKDKFKVLTQDDFESKFQERYSQERQAERLLEEGKDKEEEIDGTDGRPAFKLDKVLEYMRDNGVKTLDSAYKQMYEKEIDAWKETQLGKIKSPGLVTEQSSTAGGKQPADVKVTKDNLKEMIGEIINQE